MPKQVSPEELDHIVAAVGRHPEGVGIEGLLTHTGLDLAHRTLQRRLARLVAEGRLVTEGEGRALRYRVAPIIAEHASEEAVKAVVSPAVPVGERERFVRMVLEELENLYEGNAMCFGLRPLEVPVWREEEGRT
jgi:hypothetical protein